MLIRHHSNLVHRLMVVAGMPWVGVPTSALTVTLTYAYCALVKICHIKNIQKVFFTGSVLFWQCFYLDEYVVFENWSCDNFSGINVTTGSIQEECTNNIPYKFTKTGYINCFRFRYFFDVLLLIRLLTNCWTFDDNIMVVGEQPYKNRDMVGSDSGLGHLLVSIQISTISRGSILVFVANHFLK